MHVDKKLENLMIELPQLEEPIGCYIHGVVTGNLLFLSGKGPVNSKGKVGLEVSKEQAKSDAYQVGLYLLAAAKRELGSLDKISKVVKLLGMINSTPDFDEHPYVVNGCSELFIWIFGESGHHARSSVGVSSLPQNMTIEIEAIFEIKESYQTTTNVTQQSKSNLSKAVTVDA